MTAENLFRIYEGVRLPGAESGPPKFFPFSQPCTVNFVAVEAMSKMLTSTAMNQPKQPTPLEMWKNVLLDCASLSDARERLRRGTKELGPNYFFTEGVFFRLTLRQFAEQEASNLSIVNKLSIKAAPRLADAIHLDSGESILITEIPGCVNPPEQFSGPTPLAQETIRKLSRDFETLLTVNLVHPYAVRGYQCWHQVPELGLVVFDGWEALRHFRPDEESEVKTAYEEMLAKCSNL